MNAEGRPLLAAGAKAPWAELFLVFARAFSVPAGADHLTALRDHLVPALADLCAACEVADAEPLLVALQGSVAGLHNAETLLADYTSLFLTPPAPVPLNAALYLDGTVMGPSEVDLMLRYAAEGLTKADGFRDLNDHVVTQLEFAAHLFLSDREAEARSFVRAYPERWAPALAEALDRAAAAGGGRPWRPLAHLLVLASQTAAD